MEENKEYISEDVLNAGSDFLAHYGVKGMKWHQHKKLNKQVKNATINGMGVAARVEANYESYPLHSVAKNTASKNRGAAARKEYNGRQKLTKTIARAAAEKAENKSYTSVSKGLSKKKDRKAHRQWVEAKQKQVRKAGRKAVRDSVKTRARGYSNVNKLVSRSIASTVKHSEDTEALAHYGVKGMKWHQHKAKNELASNVASATLKSAGNYTLNSQQWNGRNALVRGLSKNQKVKEKYFKAERAAIDRKLAKQASRTRRGRRLIAQKRAISKLPNGKIKKAAIKRWTLAREDLYESL